MKNRIKLILTFILGVSYGLKAQFSPVNISQDSYKKAARYADSIYSKLSLEEKIGQLYIAALYTNRGESHITSVRKLVEQEKIGGIILMQDDAEQEIALVNEFQRKSQIPMLFGMDAEWGLSQRIKIAHKFPWAITLGAIQDNHLIYEMGKKIAEDAKKMGVYWNFAPVIDVNTNPSNPIIGNRSFGSDVENVTKKGLAYAKGLQDNGVLAAIKHFPGHGDTDKDSHLNLPIVSHSISRLNQIELAPFKELVSKKIGGIMIAHLYIPALESMKNTPASVSYNIVTNLLKKKLNYNGLIITDALNMNAVTKKYPAGELDLLAFKAGNDLLLFSQDIPSGKKLIKKAIDKGEITEERLSESVKKILKTKYLLDLHKFEELNSKNIQYELNNESHKKLSEKLYANALTLIKDEQTLLPLEKSKIYYYLPLEEAYYNDFKSELEKEIFIKTISTKEIPTIPENSIIIVGLHKDNSTAYKPYKVSTQSKKILSDLSQNHKVILNVFGSPYALKDLDIQNISTLLISYENNEFSQKATAKSYLGKNAINGRLPVLVNDQLKFGMGKELSPKK